MPTYIAILRGINVTGHNKLPMADLRSQLTKLGYENIQTYIQSGNVMFECKQTKPEELAEQIAQLIKKAWNYDVPVIVFEPDYLEVVIKSSPFMNGRSADITKLLITFLAEEPQTENIERLKSYDYQPDEIVIDKKVVYLFCPNGYGKTKYSNNFIENKLKVAATTRNWKTCNKLLEMAKV